MIKKIYILLFVTVFFLSFFYFIINEQNKEDIPSKKEKIIVKKEDYKKIELETKKQKIEKGENISPPTKNVFVQNRTLEDKKLQHKKVTKNALPTVNRRGYTPIKKRFLDEKVKKKTAKVAIIIDDLGYNNKIEDELLSINKPLTVAILPNLKYSNEVAEKFNNNGFEILLHLPLESYSQKRRLLPGTIKTSLTDEQIVKLFRENLKSVPYAKGFNQHAGSKGSKDRRIMQKILQTAKEENLFFIDSLTVPDSKGYAIAKELGIKTAKRDVFLEGSGIKDENYIKYQFGRLRSIAKKKGYAVAIGHPYPITIKVLKEMIPQFERDGIEFVYASQIVK